MSRMTRFLVISHDPTEHQTFHDLVDMDLGSAGDRLDEEGCHEVAIALAERRVGRIRVYADHVATYSLDELRLQVDQIEAHNPRDVEQGLARMEVCPWHLHREIEAILAERAEEQDRAPDMAALDSVNRATARRARA